MKLEPLQRKPTPFNGYFCFHLQPKQTSSSPNHSKPSFVTFFFSTDSLKSLHFYPFYPFGVFPISQWCRCRSRSCRNTIPIPPPLRLLLRRRTTAGRGSERSAPGSCPHPCRAARGRRSRTPMRIPKPRSHLGVLFLRENKHKHHNNNVR